MIIFTPLQNIPVELLQYKGIRQVVKYNLSSYYNDAPSLDKLVPNPSYVDFNLSLDSDEFDKQYHSYIFNNVDAFMQFMNIIIPAFTDPTVLVHIMIKNSELRDVISESLCKLVQQRYGYNICFINEVEDFMYAEESDFSIPGLFALDQDRARWLSCMPIPEDGEMYG